MIKPYTHNKFLGGQLILKQPQEGFRSGSDGVFLAAVVPDSTKGSVLDVGCGTGVVALSLARRIPGLEAVGIDCQEEVIEVAKQNAEDNGLQDRVSFLQDDALFPTGILQFQSFDHVVSNPPYFKDSTLSDDTSRAVSRGYTGSGLQAWVDYCMKMAKPRGFLHFIFPTESLQLLLNCLGTRVGGLEIYPLWPKEDSLVSKRIIVTARKDVGSPTVLYKGLILHNNDGTYTEGARRVLWDGAGFSHET
jgi:tRNA1(Val) A37 N6-methylase TrmN6